MSLGTLVICYLCNCLQGHSSHIDKLRDNSIYDHSIYIIHTLPPIHQWRLMICIAIDNGSNNTVGGSYYFAYKAVGKFGKYHIGIVSWGHRKCQTRAGVSGEDVNKTLVCVTKPDSKFSYRVLV